MAGKGCKLAFLLSHLDFLLLNIPFLPLAPRCGLTRPRPRRPLPRELPTRRLRARRALCIRGARHPAQDSEGQRKVGRAERSRAERCLRSERPRCSPSGLCAARALTRVMLFLAYDDPHGGGRGRWRTRDTGQVAPGSAVRSLRLSRGRKARP